MGTQMKSLRSTPGWTWQRIIRVDLLSNASRALPIILFLPLVWLFYLSYLEYLETGAGFGVNPDEAFVKYLGEWSIRILLVAYCITPVSRTFGWGALAKLRRFVGLTAFVYVLLHLTSYVLLYIELDWVVLLEDVIERKYVVVGFLAFFCLLLMAITSTKGWKRRLGSSWRLLHRLIHIVVLFSLLHYIWLTKDGFGVIFLYVVCFGVLSIERLVRFIRKTY